MIQLGQNIIRFESNESVDDAVFDETGEPTTPGGRGLLDLILKALAGNPQGLPFEKLYFDQRSHYGWEAEFRFDGHRYLLVIQGMPEEWLLIFAKGEPKPVLAIAEIINSCLAGIPAVFNIEWHTEESYGVAARRRHTSKQPIERIEKDLDSRLTPRDWKKEGKLKWSLRPPFSDTIYMEFTSFANGLDFQIYREKNGTKEILVEDSQPAIEELLYYLTTSKKPILLSKRLYIRKWIAITFIVMCMLSVPLLIYLGRPN